MTSHLTPAEHRMVVLTANGHPRKAIARTFGVTEHCISWHLRKLCDRFGAHNRQHLISLLLLDQLITRRDIEPATNQPATQETAC
jgi:DNA-binding CsgD family transcriptional regulator